MLNAKLINTALTFQCQIRFFKFEQEPTVETAIFFSNGKDAHDKHGTVLRQAQDLTNKCVLIANQLIDLLLLAPATKLTPLRARDSSKSLSILKPI